MTEDEERFYKNIVHSLRMRGWSKFEAESEALERVMRRRESNEGAKQ